jgi:hypothetical protein
VTAVVERAAVVMSRSVAEALGAGGVVPGSVVCAVVSDGPVAGWLVVEETALAGQERRCAIVMTEECAVVSAGPISEVVVSGDPIPTDDEMPAWASAVAGAFWSTQQARAERDAARAALRQHGERLERIVDAAHEYADENDLCGRFDFFMEGQGLRPRSRDWVCVVDAVVRVRIPVSARSADAAASVVDDDMVVNALSELRGRSLAEAVQDHDVVDTEDD